MRLIALTGAVSRRSVGRINFRGALIKEFLALGKPIAAHITICQGFRLATRRVPSYVGPLTSNQ
jgi:hypothetical protein